jgi:hypothetical protein
LVNLSEFRVRFGWLSPSEGAHPIDDHIKRPGTGAEVRPENTLVPTRYGSAS